MPLCQIRLYSGYRCQPKLEHFVNRVVDRVLQCYSWALGSSVRFHQERHTTVAKCLSEECGCFAKAAAGAPLSAGKLAFVIVKSQNARSPTYRKGSGVRYNLRSRYSAVMHRRGAVERSLPDHDTRAHNLGRRRSPVDERVTTTANALGKPLFQRSAGGEEPSFVVSRWRHGGGLVKSAGCDAAHIVLSLAGNQVVEQRIAGRTVRREVSTGSMSVMPPGMPIETEVHGEADALHLFVSTRLLNEMPGASIMMEPQFDVHDARLQQAAMKALVATRRGEPDDGLLLGAGIYEAASCLVQLNRTSDGGGRRTGGLAPSARRRVDELIDASLDQSASIALTLEDLAAEAGLSVHHFIKAFRHTVGVTPHAYALTRRLERAARLLASPGATVADVGHVTGFSSPSHFVFAFRRRMGVTPGGFREAVLI